jgi:hypothetical protein
MPDDAAEAAVHIAIQGLHPRSSIRPQRRRHLRHDAVEVRIESAERLAGRGKHEERVALASVGIPTERRGAVLARPAANAMASKDRRGSEEGEEDGRPSGPPAPIFY